MVPTLLCAAALATAPETQERPAVDAFFDATRAAAVVRDPRAQALEDLGQVAHRAGVLGVPSFYWAMRVGAAAPDWAGSGLSKEQAARRYLYLYAPLWGFEPAVLAGARLARSYEAANGAVVLRFTRDLGGVPLFRDGLSLVLTRDNGLVAISGWLTPHPAPTSSFALAPETALAFAAVDVGVVAPDPAALRGAAAEGGGWVRFFDRSRRLDSARVRQVLFELPERLEPAWHLELEGSDRQGLPQAWGLAISAVDGRVLWRKNLTERAQATLRAWMDAVPPFAPFDGPQGNAGTPHPTGQFDGTQLPFLAPGLVTADHGPNPKSDSWLQTGFTSLSGNNAIAYADVVPPQGFVPDAGPADGGDAAGRLAVDVDVPAAAATFDFTYDPAQDPRASVTQARAATTQAFVTVNYLHDWLYALGFDEVHGNAQADNLGRGGVGNDAVRVETLDWQFVEEAAMTAPADGQTPRLQLGDAVGKGPSWLIPDVADGGQLVAGQSNIGAQAFDVAGPLVEMVDGVDAGFDGCDDLTNPGALAGAIALSVSANRCVFRQMVDRAADAGAVGLVVGSNVPNAQFQAYIFGDPTGVSLPVLSVSGRDTANLLAALDAGTLPTARMQRPFVPDRPAALDSTIIAHEYAHLVSNRLVGDGTGLTVKISRSVAEGWSDFLTLLTLLRPADAQVSSNPAFGGLYAIGGYFAGGTQPDGTGNPSYYLGVRRYPYSIDPTKNGLFFRHIKDGQALPLVPGATFNTNSEVHNAGEVFASMLWEGLVAMLRSGRLSYDEVTRRMGLYLLGSMQASPLNPDFLEARDALLAVAFAGDPDDFVLLLDGFARRGAGPAAIAPPKTALNNSPVTEDATTTARFLSVDKVVLTDDPDWCDRDATLDSAESGTLRVTLRNRGSNEITGISGTVSSTSAGVTVGNAGTFTIARALPFQPVTASVPVSLSGVTDVRLLTFAVSATAVGIGNPGTLRQFDLRANADVVASTREDFETDFDWNQGWTRGGDIAPFVGFEAFFQQRKSSAIDTQLFLPDPKELADLWAVTPELKASATAALKVSFNQRFSFEVDSGGRTFDGAFLEVSTDQVTWTKLGAPELSVPYNGTIDAISRNPFAGQAAWVNRSAGYPAWVPTAVDLGTAYAGQSVWLRFHFGSDPGFPATGWEIDDLSATGIDNLPFKQVVPDRGLCVQRKPRVDAGPDRTVDERSEVVLTGTATDPDGDTLSTTWRQLAGTPVALSVDTFIAPEVTADTPLTFELSATDGNFIRQDTVTLTVRNVNLAPVVTVDPVEPVRSGDAVTLSASATDPEGDPLTFSWEQDEGSTVTLQDVTSAAAHFVAPEVSAQSTLKFKVLVTDGVDTSRGLVEVVVRPRGCGCGAGGPPLLLLAGGWLLARRRVRRGAARA